MRILKRHDFKVLFAVHYLIEFWTYHYALFWRSREPCCLSPGKVTKGRGLFRDKILYHFPQARFHWGWLELLFVYNLPLRGKGGRWRKGGNVRKKGRMLKRG